MDVETFFDKIFTTWGVDLGFACIPNDLAIDQATASDWWLSRDLRVTLTDRQQGRFSMTVRISKSYPGINIALSFHGRAKLSCSIYHGYIAIRTSRGWGFSVQVNSITVHCFGLYCTRANDIHVSFQQLGHSCRQYPLRKPE